MRDGTNHMTRTVFGAMTPAQIAESAGRVIAINDTAIDDAVAFVGFTGVTAGRFEVAVDGSP